MTNVGLTSGAEKSPDRDRAGERASTDIAAMSRRNHLICAWTGPLIMLGFGVGLPLAGYLPPPRADDSIQRVVEVYTPHTDRLRVGLLLMMLGGAFFASFSSAISVQLRRIEGGAGPLADTQRAAGAANVVVFTLGAMVMIAAAFRPDRNPALTQALHDLGWMFFTVYVSPLLVQTLAIGTAIVGGGHQTVYPRWVGYLNFWVALTFLVAVLAAFFKSGPFAWHGILVYWLGFVVLFSWFVAMTITTVRAIKHTDLDHV